MPVHKRKKKVKMRGSKTHGWGSKKKHRGSGNRGGFGMAGTGKRAHHKKPTIIKLYGNLKNYFGKKGFRRPQKIIINENAINIEELEKLPQTEINLESLGYTKLLGKGNPTRKYEIIVKSFSKKAKDKIEKLGGKINPPK